MSLLPADETFDAFWRAYPRHVAKKDAQKAWKSLKPSASLVTKILAALEWQREQPDWKKAGHAYVPYPASYLRGERWTDPPPARTGCTSQAEHWQDACARLHGGTCGSHTRHFLRLETEKARA